MKLFEYRSLGEDALQLLERDSEARSLYLDFLTFLHDIVNTQFAFGEPCLLDERTRVERITEAVGEMPADADIQAAATENREKALALVSNGADEEAAGEFMKALLNEYNVVRLLRSRDGVRREAA